MNGPNLLTLSRLAGIPILMVLLLVSFPLHYEVATILFVAFSATDTLDGRLARASSQVTEMGKFLDPLADKLFILSVLIVLVEQGLLAAWFVVVIFAREMAITVLRSLSATQGRVIAASPWGKTKTVTQVGAVILLMLQRPYPVLQPVALAAIGLATAFTIGSGIDYLWRFRHVIQSVPDLTGAGTPSFLGPDTVEPVVAGLARRLSDRDLSLALAESCTGGLVAALVTQQPGVSAHFKGGVVAYTNQLKMDLLDVPQAVLERWGAVSAQCAEAMASGARARLEADLAASVTGIAGPGAEGTEKPVGLTYIGIASESGVRSWEFRFQGDRWSNRRKAALQVLHLLDAELSEPRPTEEGTLLDSRTHVR